MTYSREALKGRSVSELGMLTGHWRGVNGDDIFDEYWLPETRGNMACVFRWLKGDSIYIYEIVALIEKNAEIHMMLRHFNEKFVASEEIDKPLDFIVTELTTNKVVFVNRSNPDGGYLQYDMSEEGYLRFQACEPDGSVSFGLDFERVR